MTALSAEVSAELDKRLRASRENLLGHIQSRLPGPDEPASTSQLAHLGQPDDASQADNIGDNERAQLGQEQNELRAIDAAIARLAAGIANVCTVCGQDIPEARLLATPSVHTCIDCQQKIEQGDWNSSRPTM
jgi:RNA polymerase-binding transcription factor DksA